jgi:hypothetical protein
MVSTPGESDKNLMETPFHMPRRLDDDQCARTQTPAEFAQGQQAFMHTAKTTAHQGLRQEPFPPPMPLEGLGETTGRLSTPADLARQLVQGLLLRTTNPYGWVTLHSYHGYVEAGVPKTPGLRWGYGEPWRAVLDNVSLAAYHCRSDWQTRTVTDRRDSAFYPTRFAAPQAALLPLHPQEALVVYRPQGLRRPTPRSSPAQPLWLCELGHPA